VSNFWATLYIRHLYTYGIDYFRCLISKY